MGIPAARAGITPGFSALGRRHITSCNAGPGQEELLADFGVAS